MTKIKLCNVHKLAVANEGEERKPIFIPFGTWPYDDMISQTLDRPHAEGIAADLDKQIAAGEPGIPVYQGHPDVPEYAGKYPDKGAMGWVKKILVNEDGMECQVEWDRDPGKGFGWFSPYWIGDKPVVGPDGKKNVIVDGLTSIGLVNNPNIREFRLANEAGEDLTQRGGAAEIAAFKLPDHLLALAKRFDDRMALANVIDANGMGHSEENGQFDGSGSGNGGGGGSSYGKKLVATRQAAVDAAQKTFDEAKSALIAGQKRGWSKEENDKAFKAYDRAERKLKFAKSELRTAIGAPSISHEEQVRRDSKSVFRGTATKAERDRYMSELAKRFDERAALAKRSSGPSGGGASVADKFNAAASKAAKDPAAMKFNDALAKARKAKDGAGIARAHTAALKAGMVWDSKIKGYRPPVVKVN